MDEYSFSVDFTVKAANKEEAREQLCKIISQGFALETVDFSNPRTPKSIRYYHVKDKKE